MMKNIAYGLILISAVLVTWPSGVLAQEKSTDLVDMLRFARIQAIAERHMRENGARMPVLPPQHLESLADTLGPWIDEMFNRLHPRVEPEPIPELSIESWEVVPKLEIPVYRKRFTREDWAFLGANERTPIDTMLTVDIRARLQHHFGDPTRTMVEVGYPDSLAREEIIQFEYWFILNDSIQVLLMDVNGPRDRGVVFASSAKYRHLLFELKHALLGQLVETNSRTQYADFYYNFDQRVWYVAGFNGARLFTMRIDRPNLILGRPGIERFFPRDGTPPGVPSADQ